MAQPLDVVSYPATILPIAETCPGVLDLAARSPWLGGLDSQWREVFHLGAKPPTAHTVESYRVLKQGLPDLMAVDVEDAISAYQAEAHVGGSIPSVHRFSLYVDGDLEGRVPAQGRERIHATVDCAWTVTPGGTMEGARAVVLRHELARLGRPLPTDLDLVFAGIAMAAIYKLDCMQLGRCYHSPGKRPTYAWSGIIGPEAMGAQWERIARLFRRRRELVPTDLCESCPLRRACPAWMLPVAHGGLPAYRMLTGQDPVAANDVSQIRRFVKSLREGADMADAQLRTLKRDGAT